MVRLYHTFTFDLRVWWLETYGPNAGVMVIYHGGIRKNLTKPTNKKNIYTWHLDEISNQTVCWESWDALGIVGCCKLGIWNLDENNTR